MGKTFELLTGTWCFDPKQNEGISLDAHHLALMVALTGETILENCFHDRRPEFWMGLFVHDGKVLQLCEVEEIFGEIC